MGLHQSEHGVARHGLQVCVEGNPAEAFNTIVIRIANVSENMSKQLRENNCISSRGLQIIESMRQLSREVKVLGGVGKRRFWQADITSPKRGGSRQTARLFCASLVAMRAGSAQVTLFELRWS